MYGTERGVLLFVLGLVFGAVLGWAASRELKPPPR
jgi:HAMP domain-containing protein